MQSIPMTAAGAEKLQAELNRLKQIERPRIIQAIAEARAHGDLKENAEYHAARELQSLSERRIAEIEAKLGLIKVIDITQMENTGRVIFGATIELLQGSRTVIFQIVGEEEADLGANKISVTSPVARALVGKHEGDQVEVSTPEGAVVYEIVKVDYI